ncbi:MAG: DUF1801 domain-containing protein [Candidatus Limnocylindria bacterium]
MATQITMADHLRSIPAAVRPIVRAARRTVKAAAPKAKEVAYQTKAPRYRSALWKLARYQLDDDDVAGIGIFPTYAHLYFYRGRELDDGSGVLEGGGKSMRSIRLASPADAGRPAVRRILRKAFALSGRAG